MRHFDYDRMKDLVEWVGASSPVSEEQAEADGLEETRQDTNGNSVDRSILSDKGGDELKQGAGC